MKPILIFYFSILLLVGACSPGLKDIQQQVASDAVESYELSQKAGDKTEICVKAGMVAEAYNQAQDHTNYLAWKEKEKADCALAGIQK